MTQVIEKHLLGLHGNVYAKAVENELVLSKRLLRVDQGDTPGVSIQEVQNLDEIRRLVSRFRRRASVNASEWMVLQANPKQQSILGLLR
jgi:hypothetical protein